MEDVFKTKGGQIIGATKKAIPAQEALHRARTPAELIFAVKALGKEGEQGAFEFGNAELVGAVLAHQSSPEVQAACIEALGNMIGGGEQYASRIALLTKSRDEAVATAACTALGMFGDTGLEYEDELADVIKAARSEGTTVAAISSLGWIGCSEKAEMISRCLLSPSPQIVAASCQALGNIGVSDAATVSSIAGSLKVPEVRFAAVTALVELGQSACMTCLGDLIQYGLKDKDSLTRNAAAQAIGACADEVLEDRTYKSDIKSLLEHKDPGIRCSAAMVFGYIGAKAVEVAGEAIAALLGDAEEDVSEIYLQVGGGHNRVAPSVRKPCCAALIALGMMGAEEYAESCAALCGNDSWEVKVCALECLAGMGKAGREQENKIMALMDDSSYIVRQKACNVVAELEIRDAASTLAGLFEDKTPAVRTAAFLAMANLEGVAADYPNEIFKGFTDMFPGVKAAAIKALGAMGEPGAGFSSIVATALSDEDEAIRAAAAEALGKLGSHGASYASDVAYLLSDPVSEVRSAAIKGLSHMSAEGKQFLSDIEACMDDPATNQAAEEAMQALGP